MEWKTTKEENADIRLTKLQQDFDSKNTELDKANKLIQSLQDSAKTNDVEGMKTKILDYEKQIKQLKEENKKEKIKY